MNFECSELPDAFFLDEAPTKFKVSLVEIAKVEWGILHECRECGAFWVIDAWDKYHHQVANRVVDRAQWQSATTEQRKDLLLKYRGGVDEGECVWAECRSRSVKGVALCVDHLFSSGIRR